MPPGNSAALAEQQRTVRGSPGLQADIQTAYAQIPRQLDNVAALRDVLSTVETACEGGSYARAADRGTWPPAAAGRGGCDHRDGPGAGSRDRTRDVLGVELREPTVSAGLGATERTVPFALGQSLSVRTRSRAAS